MQIYTISLISANFEEEKSGIQLTGILCDNAVTPQISHCAFIMPRLILRSRSEGRAKPELRQRMNGQPANEYRRTIERLSKELRLCYDSSSTKVQKFNEKCKQKHYYPTHLLVFALSCLKLRRNDIIPTPFSQINLSMQIFINRTLYIFQKMNKGNEFIRFI